MTINHNPLLYLKYFGNYFRPALIVGSTFVERIRLYWGYKPTANGRARYISKNNKVIWRLKLPNGLIGNIFIF